MSQEEIDRIVADVREKYVISDEEVESVLELCRRKIALTGKTDDYMELLLPDELRHHIAARAINTISIFILEGRREECAACAE